VSSHQRKEKKRFPAGFPVKQKIGRKKRKKRPERNTTTHYLSVVYTNACKKRGKRRGIARRHVLHARSKVRGEKSAAQSILLHPRLPHTEGGERKKGELRRSIVHVSGRQTQDKGGKSHDRELSPTPLLRVQNTLTSCPPPSRKKKKKKKKGEEKERCKTVVGFVLGWAGEGGGLQNSRRKVCRPQLAYDDSQKEREKKRTSETFNPSSAS